MKTYFSRHLQVLFATLGSMARSPLMTLNTSLVVGVTLLLPLMLYIATKSAAQLTDNWQGRPQVSIFLEQDVSSDEANLIFDELRLHPAIQIAELIRPEQALVEFKALSKLDFELDLLQENPLPTSIVIMPTEEFAERQPLLALKDELEKIDGIENIRLDLEWTDRFNTLLKLTTQVTWILSLILAIAIILVVGNTIRLLMINRRQEIEVTKLVGGTNPFVRRPFLYFGTLFGFTGALLALGLLVAISFGLEPRFEAISHSFKLEGLLYRLTLSEISLFLIASSALGWLAARLCVAQHLRKIRPQ